jgi:enoyl-CoA hydratase/carnithine racemase
MTAGESNGQRTLPWHVDVPPIRRWVQSMEADGQGDAAYERVRLWDQMVEEHGVVNVSRDGRIGIIELSYPSKGNAIVPPMYRMFVEAMRDLSMDDDVWAIVIRGKGHAFSTGGYVGHDAFYAGLDAGSGGSKAEPMRRTFVELFQLIPLSVYNCEKPTIAQVNGTVMAESVDIALSADFRTGSPSTHFRFSFAATGNTAYTGAAWSLPRLIGLSRAKQFLLTADHVDGQRAYDAGLLNWLFTDEDLVEETIKIAKRFESLPPITLRLIKKEIARGQGIGEFSTALDIYSCIEPIVQFTEDHMDAENAVIEKRPAVVRGR